MSFRETLSKRRQLSLSVRHQQHLSKVFHGQETSLFPLVNGTIAPGRTESTSPARKRSLCLRFCFILFLCCWQDHFLVPLVLLVPLLCPIQSLAPLSPLQPLQILATDWEPRRISPDSSMGTINLAPFGCLRFRSAKVAFGPSFALCRPAARTNLSVQACKTTAPSGFGSARFESSRVEGTLLVVYAL